MGGDIESRRGIPRIVAFKTGELKAEKKKILSLLKCLVGVLVVNVTHF
jgi:hypothetical protein